MKKKILLTFLIVMAALCMFAISISATDADPYADYYDKSYTAIDGTSLALYDNDTENHYPLAWFYDSVNSKYEKFRVGTEVVFAINGGTTQIPAGTDFRENASVVFTDSAKTYTMENLILINLQGTNTTYFSGNWSKLPIQAIYCNINFAYVNGSTFSGNTSLTVFDIPKAHSAQRATICTAFSKCTNLKEIYIPKNVCVLGSAFEYSGLQKVEFAENYDPKGVFDWQTTTGKSHWFNGCTALTTVILPITSPTHNYLGQKTFAGCTSLESIVIPAGFTLIDDYAFQNCSALNTVTFAGNAGANAVIDQAAFENCTALTSIVIPEGVTTLGNCIFKSSALTTVTLPTTLTTLNGGEHFYRTALTSVIGLENTQITSIPGSIFRGLGSWKPDVIVLPNTVTSIGQYGFADVGMKSIVLGAGMTTLDTEAFVNCKNLESVYLPSTLTSVKSTAFTNNLRNDIVFFLTSNDEEYIATIQSAVSAGKAIDNVSYEEYLKNPEGYVTGRHLVYGLETCEIFYNDHNVVGVESVNKFKGEAYLTSYVCVKECTQCGGELEEEISAPLFVNKGYSKELGGSFFTYGIVINKDEIAKYIAAQGEGYVFNYGIVLANAELSESGNLFDENGEAISGAYTLDITNVNYTIYNLKVTGIGEAQKDTPIYASAYVIDNSAVSYIGENVTEKAVPITFNTVKKYD